MVGAKGTQRLRTAVAWLMVADMFLVMVTPVDAELVHEYAGIAMTLLFLWHIILNRRWFSSLRKGKYGPQRVISLVIVALMAICIIGIAVSSFIISKFAFGFLPMIPGSSWARLVHLSLSHWLYILVFFHAGMNIRFPAWREHLAGSGAMSSAKKLAPFVIDAVLAILGFISFAYVGAFSYMFLIVQFYGYSDPYWLILCLYALMAIGFAALGQMTVGICRLVDKRKQHRGLIGDNSDALIEKS